MQNFKTLVSFIAFLVLFNSSSFASIPTAAPTSEDPVPAWITSAVKEFKSLPRSERKAKFREVRKLLKEYRANKKAGKVDDSDNHILAIIFAILIPPVGVLIYQGKITTKFWISLVLTLLFWLPGAIYSLLVVTGNA